MSSKPYVALQASLAVVQLIAVVAAVYLLEAGQSNADQALCAAGVIALALSGALMAAGFAVEVYEWFREDSLSQG
ncbi:MULTISPECIES: hypothetical protein [Pseudomonas syringae group]|uniref:hypothetical protein n=1 Tax=Pseudomonas syringae group TaxID=136849 RepID=UPI0006D5F0CA|nr:hypothetical protein [Pseudomonas coronafaciens]KPX31931.1 Uncharacterized protein ALO77_00007 [Pseudomonas coronafaciens pv. garcae]RMV81973.1 hypothetical protein ALP02_02455 [Pseudomonas coronafaciens pv. garcae]